MAWQWWLGLSTLVILLVAFLLRRRIRLTMKYEDDELVEKLMDESFWRGQTRQQLLDALGEPLDIDQKVTKTKMKEVWKYEQTGKNRYALKIRLEDGVVVGWDQT